MIIFDDLLLFCFLQGFSLLDDLEMMNKGMYI